MNGLQVNSFLSTIVSEDIFLFMYKEDHKFECKSLKQEDKYCT